jgi:hypothetical protein
MSDKRTPWLKWYPADWRADPRLRMCSLAARGLWIEMLGFMHEAERYGFLLIAGIAPSPEELAVLVGAPAPLVRKALDELETRGVYSRDGDGVIYSRRMVRDKAKADADRANGKRGGNPSLTDEVNPSLDLGVNPPDKAQRPETRDQRPEKEDSASGKPRGDLTAKQLEEFEAWWQHYPKRVARKEAERAFLKARKSASLEELIAGAKRYAASITDPKFTAHPATWLNAGRWSDEGPGATAANGLAVSVRRAPRGPPPPLAEGWDRDL